MCKLVHFNFFPNNSEKYVTGSTILYSLYLGKETRRLESFTEKL